MDIIDISLAQLWFLARNVIGGHWACVGEQYIYGGREKSRGSLEMVEDGVESYFKRESHFTKILKLVVFYGGF